MRAAEPGDGASSSVIVIIPVITNAIIFTFQKRPDVIPLLTCELNHATKPGDSSKK